MNSKKREIGMEFNYTPKYPVQTLQKAIEILMYIKENGVYGWAYNCRIK